MDKKAKIIISILLVIIVILLAIIIKQNSNLDSSVVGIYYTDDFNNSRATIELNADKTCKYPQTTQKCKWEQVNDKVNIYLEYYKIVMDNDNDLNEIPYYSLEICKQSITENSKTYNLINPHCEPTDVKFESKLIDDGLLLNDIVFKKIK